ncbi:uncharacterized protein LOC124941914 [Impatiens glandulifera]|uniref:uncharacterized protein LOC124941914 n=1 Tax=Impatiens glandulifera TaxID=253017 RepID=UPI001FB04EC6|nr:uncharacterized protein LOC124941914 [Impatiens glandulifera]
MHNPLGPSFKWNRNHPPELIIGNPNASLRIRYQLLDEMANSAFISRIEPKKINEALLDPDWINAKYTKELLKKFGMENCSAPATPMISSIKLDKDEDGQSVDITAYRGIIGSFLYLTTSRPYIQFVVGTMHVARLIGRVLVGRANSLMRDYDIKANKSPVFCDNTSAIAITYNPVLHSRTKHIDIRHNFIREYVSQKHIRLEYVPTDQQVVDMFTKPLPEIMFSYFRNVLGLVDLN